MHLSEKEVADLIVQVDADCSGDQLHTPCRGLLMHAGLSVGEVEFGEFVEIMSRKHAHSHRRTTAE